MDHSSGQWPPHEAESSGDLNSLIYQSEMTNSLHQIMESLAQELKNPPPPSPNYATATAARFPFEQPSSSSRPSAEFNDSFMDISFGKHIAAAREEALMPRPPPLPPAVELPQVSSSSIFSFWSKDSSLDPAAQLFISAVEANHEINSNTSGGLFSPTWSETTTTTTMKTVNFQTPEEKKSGGSRPPSGAQDHVIAERRRRERINQQFIALSTIIPGLKKTDKASLLGDAINHIRQLEEKVKNLEDKASEKTVESTILVKKSHHTSMASNSDDQEMMISTDPAATGSSSSEGSRSSSMTLIPRITASLNGSSILVRIQCEKRKGLFVKVLSQLEKHHLSVINTSCMPFASSSLNITVTAQVEEGFSVTMKDLVKDLDSALSHF